MKRHSLILGCFAVFFPLVILAAYRDKSPTADEAYHLFAGYTYVKWGDFRVYPEHPPLAKILAGLPLLALDIKDPRLAPQWDQQQYRYLMFRMVFRDNDPDKLFFYARLPLILVGVLLGIFIYLWAGELYGPPGAIGALALYALDPNILAHSPIGQTDISFSAFFFIASYFLFRCLRRLTWRDLSGAALFCGLATVTKYSFVAIFTIWLAVILVRVFTRTPQSSEILLKGDIATRRGKALLLGVLLGAVLLVTYVSIWAVYRFRWDAAVAGAVHLPLVEVLPKKPLMRAVAEWIAGSHLFPEAAFFGVLDVAKHFERISYLFGEISPDGFWLYFPVAFAVKTPVPTLILFVVAIYLGIRRRLTATEGFLAFFAAAYFAFAVASRFNIGIRHILPAYPFLYVLLGGVVSVLWKSRSRAARAFVIFLGVWLVAGTAYIHPHYLAYFNELAGGPSNGYKILVDSNLDWGQDLKGLKQYVEKNRMEPVYLSYFGNADPCYYRLRFVELPRYFLPPYTCPEEPRAPPGFIAISATDLVSTYLRYLETYKWLMHKQPVARIGYSIFVYDIRGDTLAHKYLGFIYLREAKIDEAVREFAFAGERMTEKQLAEFDFGTKPEVYGGLGVAFFEKGMLEAAAISFRRAIALNLADSDMYNNLGIVYLRQGKVEEAIGVFKLALKADPENYETYNQLGKAYSKVGHGNDAIAAYREVLRLDPDHREAAEALQRLAPKK